VAGRLWRLRQRFGIAAPRVAVHSAIPWYWRSLGVAAMLASGAFGGLWFYERAARTGGGEVPELRRELGDVRGLLERAHGELEQFRAVANAADSRVSIERSAQNKLAQQLRALEQENARLREDLAMFDSLLAPGQRGALKLAVQRFEVEPDVLAGEYRYRVVVFTPSARRDRDFQGKLELLVSLVDAGRSAIITFPEPADAGAASFRLRFRHFQRVEGTFRVSAEAKVESVQVRVYEEGSAQPRVTRVVKLGQGEPNVQ
jgi:hypothetical protein